MFRGEKRRRSGNVAVITALSITPVAALAGFGMDLMRANAVRAEIQEAVDAAALAAARRQALGAVDLATLRQSAENAFAANTPQVDAGACTPMTLTANAGAGVVNVGVTCAVQTMFPLLVAMDAWDIGVAAESRYERTRLDLALMLDVTGSMSGQKLIDLKNAAKDLVDIVTAPGMVDTDVRIALAPFATTLNAGPYASAVTGDPAPASPCVTERTGPDAFTDAAPGPGAYHPIAAAWCPAPSLTPLSDDPVHLKARIDALTAGGMTAGHLGIAFARYLIAPEWAGVWPAGSTPHPQDASTIKTMVLMSDGMFNMQFSALGSSAAQAQALCTAAKTDGHVIYAVAYQAPPAAETLLRNCASDPSKFFATSTGAALAEAYQAIALDMMRLRVSS
jgi:Flp pilus assembly protein TadG